MLKPIAVFAMTMSIAAPALADGMDYTPRRHYPARFYLPAERHVIEVVQPPYSGNFIINGRRFVGQSPACLRWAAARRMTTRRTTQTASRPCSTVGTSPAG